MSAGKDGNSSQGSFIGCRLSHDPLKGTPVAAKPRQPGFYCEGSVEEWSG